MLKTSNPFYEAGDIIAIDYEFMDELYLLLKWSRGEVIFETHRDVWDCINLKTGGREIISFDTTQDLVAA